MMDESNDEDDGIKCEPVLSPPCSSQALPEESEFELTVNEEVLLYEQSKAGFSWDVQLDVDGVELFAHKSVLVAKCPFFAGMFSSGLEETKTGVIKLQHVTASAVESLLEFLYIGKCDLTVENVWELIHISNMYQVTTLFERCEKFLCDSVSMDNYLDIAELASELESEKLRSAVADFISSDWEERKESCELAPLDEHIFERIISCKDIQGCNDEEIASSILEWIAYRPSRIQHYKRLSENIPFKSLRRDYLIQTFLKHRIFSDRPDLVDFTLDRILEEWEEFHLSDDSSVLLEFKVAADGRSLSAVRTEGSGDSQSFAGCGYVGRITLSVAEQQGGEIRFRIEGNFRFVTGVPCRDVLFVIEVGSLRGSTAVIQKRFVHNLTQTVQTPVLDIKGLSWFTVYVKVFVH